VTVKYNGCRDVAAHPPPEFNKVIVAVFPVVDELFRVQPSEANSLLSVTTALPEIENPLGKVAVTEEPLTSVAVGVKETVHVVEAWATTELPLKVSALTEVPDAIATAEPGWTTVVSSDVFTAKPDAA